MRAVSVNSPPSILETNEPFSVLSQNCERVGGVLNPEHAPFLISGMAVRASSSHPGSASLAKKCGGGSIDRHFRFSPQTAFQAPRSCAHALPDSSSKPDGGGGGGGGE